MCRTILALALLLGSGCVVPAHVADATESPALIQQTAAESEHESGLDRTGDTWEQIKEGARIALWTPYMLGAAALYFTTGIGGPPL